MSKSNWKWKIIWFHKKYWKQNDMSQLFSQSWFISFQNSLKKSFRNSWNRMRKLFFFWNSRFQQSNSQYLVFTQFFEQYVIIFWEFYNVRIETFVNFNCNRVRKMRIIVTFDSNCISLKKRKNAKLIFDFDLIRQ